MTQNSKIGRFIAPGKHGVIVGKNGGGKSQQLINLALNNKQRVVIFDTKIDDDFLFLAEENEILQVAESYKELGILLNKAEFDYLIIRPQDFELSDPNALDNYLKLLSQCKNLTIFIDEAYQFHNAGKAGSGYISILTRGRSRKLSLVVCTQRPVWISTFSFSESTYFYIYELTMLTDRRKIKEFVPIPEPFQLSKYFFYFWDSNCENVVQCPPVEVFKRKLYKPKKRGLINMLWGSK